MKVNIHRLIALQELLSSFNQVDRRAHRKHRDLFVPENDTEHSYNLAMTAWYLSKWFPKLNKAKLLEYALVHDLVEVHAGDTYIYGTKEELDSKKEREANALTKLENEWPDFEDMIAAIHDYERRENSESRFIYALDKLMPIMLIYIHDGYTWKNEGITVDMLYKAKIDKVRSSPEIYSFFKDMHAILTERPDLIKLK